MSGLEGWALVEERLIVGRSARDAVNGTLLTEQDVFAKLSDAKWRNRIMDSRYAMIAEHCGVVAARTAASAVKAIEVLERIITNSESERNRMSAAKMILDHLGRIQDIMAQLEGAGQQRTGFDNVVMTITPEMLVQASSLARRLEIPEHAIG